MNNALSKVLALITLDFKVEYRNKSEIYGLVLFVVVISYILYRSTEDLDLLNYNRIFWVFLLVLSTNFSLRSFTKIKIEESRYLYQLSDSTSIILSKLVYNALLIFSGGLLFLLSGLLFHAYDGFPYLLFIGLLAIVSMALSSTFSLPSALVFSLSSKGTLLGILAFPISIPVILISMNLGNDLLVSGEFNMSGVMMLCSIILIMGVMSLLLFRYNWQA